MTIRNSSFHGANGYSFLRPRNLTFKKVVKEVMRSRLNDQFMVQMENMMRRIVQEEFVRRIQPYLSSSCPPIERSRSETLSSRSRFKLRFMNSPPLSIFTGSKIEAEDGSPVMIELVDTSTNLRVVSGPFSYSRVEIVPLNADFTAESWTVELFKENILKQRESKRPLLTGNLTVTLKNGVGVIDVDVTFSDNSSWTRSGKFRLGARLTGGGGAVEARSEAFGCKDQRGKSYEKHYPPYPGDEVWRLEKIAKDGVSAKRLAECEIFTVKEFRRCYTMNPTALYNILHGVGGGISKRTWKAIVSHAMDCVLDETECYIYNANANGVSLLLNSVYEVIKVSFSGSDGPFQNVHQLTNAAPFIEQLKLEAYQNPTRFTAVNGRIFEEQHPQRSLHCPQNLGFGLAGPEMPHMDFQGSSVPSSSSMSVYFPASNSMAQPEMLMNLENSTFHIDGKFLPTLRNSFRANEYNPLHNESQTLTTRENEKDENTFADHHHHRDIHANWSPGTERWTQQTLESLCVSVSGTEEDGMYNVRIANIVGSPRARWCKVKAAFKIREVWRNTTARNRIRSLGL